MSSLWLGTSSAWVNPVPPGMTRSCFPMVAVGNRLGSGLCFLSANNGRRHSGFLPCMLCSPVLLRISPSVLMSELMSSFFRASIYFHGQIFLFNWLFDWFRTGCWFYGWNLHRFPRDDFITSLFFSQRDYTECLDEIFVVDSRSLEGGFDVRSYYVTPKTRLETALEQFIHKALFIHHDCVFL